MIEIIDSPIFNPLYSNPLSQGGELLLNNGEFRKSYQNWSGEIDFVHYPDSQEVLILSITNTLFIFVFLLNYFILF